MIDPIREALAELVACCTEPAGWSVDMLGDRQLFNEMFARSNDRLQAAIDAARAALAAQPAQELVDEKRLRSTDRADVWAEEFAKVIPSVDRGLMIAWFANCRDSQAA
jgi:hypothetical protein